MMILPWLMLVTAVAGPIERLAHDLQTEVITLTRGTGEVLQLPADLSRVAIADPRIADAIVLSPREVLINAVAIGSTSLIVWDASDTARIYTIGVTFDIAGLQRQYAALFPDEELEVTASGNIVVLSGFVSGGEVARRMVAMARATGATVIENFACIRPSVVC
jgi:pilus assembly protein CpaC